MIKGKDISLWMKIFYFLPLAVFGVMHFVFPHYFEFLVPKFIPGGIFWIYFSGAILTSTSLAIIFGIIPRIASFCLILFVITFIITVDIPGFVSGDEDHYRFFISFLKDLSLCGGTFLFWKFAN